MWEHLKITIKTNKAEAAADDLTLPRIFQTKQVFLKSMRSSYLRFKLLSLPHCPSS